MDGVPVSILDFVLMLQAAKTMLRRDGSAEIGLSDRGDRWWFTQHDERVSVRIRGPLDQAGSKPARPHLPFEHRKTGLANATIQQRLVPFRLFCDLLREDGLRESNPVRRDRCTPGRRPRPRCCLPPGADQPGPRGS